VAEAEFEGRYARRLAAVYTSSGDCDGRLECTRQAARRKMLANAPDRSPFPVRREAASIRGTNSNNPACAGLLNRYRQLPSRSCILAGRPDLHYHQPSAVYRLSLSAIRCCEVPGAPILSPRRCVQ